MWLLCSRRGRKDVWHLTLFRGNSILDPNPWLYTYIARGLDPGWRSPLNCGKYGGIGTNRSRSREGEINNPDNICSYS